VASVESFRKLRLGETKGGPVLDDKPRDLLELSDATLFGKVLQIPSALLASGARVGTDRAQGRRRVRSRRSLLDRSVPAVS
jgi:hypothetical protein